MPIRSLNKMESDLWFSTVRKDSCIDFFVMLICKNRLALSDTPSWSKGQQSRYIERLMLRLPTSPIVFLQKGDDVVDYRNLVKGEEELQSLRAWVEGELVLSDMRFLHELNGVSINDLDNVWLRHLYNRGMPFYIVSCSSLALARKIIDQE